MAWIDCGTNFIEQDVIRFEEAVWSKPRAKKAKSGLALNPT